MQQVDFERLFQKLPSPHMVLDRDLRFVAVNAAYEKVTMRRSEELVGRGMFEVFPNEGDGGKRLRDSFLRVFERNESDTLAYLRYEIPVPAERGGGLEERYWTAVHTPLEDSAGNIRYLMQNTVDVTDIVRMREAISLPYRAPEAEVQLIERAREAEDTNRALMAESADFRRLFSQAPQMIAVLSGPQHLFTFANDAYRTFLGNRDVVGMTVREAVPEVDGQGFFDMLDDVFRNGQEHSGEGVRVMVGQGSGRAPREAFMDFSYRPIRDAGSKVTGVFVQGMDRTDAVRNARHQRLLLDEVNHRVKNTLATVQSIASQTLRSARDLPSAKRDFEARIIALSKAHNLLSARSWSDLEMETVVRQQLAGQDGERVNVSGPSVLLDSKAAIAVSMLMHELASNAARHGALSAPEGKLSVAWHFTADDRGPRLLIEWRESGGPAVDKPEHRGFGGRMLERVATGELGGGLVTDYAPEGFFCQIDMPANNLVRGKPDVLQS